MTTDMLSEALPDDELDQIGKMLEPWRFFLGAWGYGIYIYAVQQNNYGARNPGRVDSEQAIYLTNCHVFVTADVDQRRMLRLLVPFGQLPRSVWLFERFAAWAKSGCPDLVYFSQSPGPVLTDE